MRHTVSIIILLSLIYQFVVSSHASAHIDSLASLDSGPTDPIPAPIPAPIPKPGPNPLPPSPTPSPASPLSIQSVDLGV